jgi:hypothetical protein
MPRSFTRVEMRVSPERRKLLEGFRDQLSKRLNKRVTLSETLAAIVDEFFERSKEEKLPES